MKGFTTGFLWLDIVLALAVYSWFATWTGFFVMATAKRIIREGAEIPLRGQVMVLIWLVLGWPGDFIYNAIIGTIEYREFPKWLRGEFMYSHRIERLANHREAVVDVFPADGLVHYQGNDWRRDKALPFARMLNGGDPGHIDLQQS